MGHVMIIYDVFEAIPLDISQILKSYRKEIRIQNGWCRLQVSPHILLLEASFSGDWLSDKRCKSNFDLL